MATAPSSAIVRAAGGSGTLACSPRRGGRPGGVRVALTPARRGVRLPAGFTARLPEAFGALTASDVRAACKEHLRPDDAGTVAVTTAELAREPLAAVGALTVEHDAY